MSISDKAARAARLVARRMADGGSVNRPRVFYKGSNPGDDRRISTGNKDWDSHTFVSANRDDATMYGKTIHRYTANPDARILHEGTREWSNVAGSPRRNENLLDYSSRAANAAKTAGYHAAAFKRQGDVGTAIFDPSKFSVEPDKIEKAGGGSLSDAINSFSQARNAQLTRPAAGSDVASQLAMYQQSPQLMVAEPQQHRQQPPASQGVGDLGAEIDEGARWLSGTPDDDKVAPAKGSSQNKSIGKNNPPSQSVSDGDPISTVVAGIKHLETGGLKDPYNYVSPAGAIGAYGVMPGTLASWTRGTKYEGISPEDYKNNPNIQDDVARIGATNYYNQYNGDVSKVGQAWLGGPGSVGKSSKDPYTGISTDQYGNNLANIVNSQHPQPQAQATPPQPTPPSTNGAPTNGPQAQADPMSNLYNKVALGPEVAAGYDNPQAMFAPGATAKRGGRMRKRLDDGGDAGGDGGDGGDGGAAANAAAANAAAGYGSGVTGQAAAAGYGGVGMGSPAGAPAGTSTTGTGGFGGFGGGDNGFGGASATGTSVGVGPGVSTAGVGGVGNAGVGGVGAPSGGVAGPSGGGGGATGAGPGGTGGGGGTASGGSGTTLAQQYAALVGGTPAFYDAGFGLGKGGAGNVAAGQSNTAALASLQNSPMRYGFVQGNDPGLANSNTGKAALGTAPAPNLMAQQFAALTGQGANNGPQGVGFGGGSGVGSNGVSGFNSSPTGAEGVSTSQLGPAPNLMAQQFAAATGQGTPGVSATNVNALNAQLAQLRGNQGSPVGPGATAPAPGNNAPGQSPTAPPATQGYTAGTGGFGGDAPFSQSPQTVHQAPPVAPPPVNHAPGERVQRGGYLHRASGGEISSMPTDELIEYALTRLRQRRNAASGGSQTSTGSTLAQQYAVATGQAPPGTGNTQTTYIPIPNTAAGGGDANTDRYGHTNAPTWDAVQLPTNTASASTPQTPAAPTANNPAIPSGVVGNHGGFGGTGGVSGSPIGGVPNAQPNGAASNSTNPNGPQYNNTLDQALQTNNPTNDQIFGFTYPSVPPPKPQPVGPVSQNQINAEFGIGGGSQVGTGAFQVGGAVIMDAALNKARKAIKGNKRYV